MKPLFGRMDQLMPLLDAGYAVLTPNRRLSRAVRDAEARHREERGERVWTSSRIMPLREYWKSEWKDAVTRGEVSAATLADATCQTLLWQRAIAEDPGGFNLLGESRAAALCQEASERLALWRIDTRDPRVQQQFSFDPDSSHFLRWHARVSQLLVELGAITPEQALEALLSRPQSLRRPVALLEIAELAPLHRALVEASPANCKVSARAARAGQPTVRVFADTQAELQAAARWCAQQVKEDPQGRYGVVLTSMDADRDRFEYLLRREFDCLTSNYASLPVNFSTGFSLARVPIVRDALRILGLSAEQVEVEEAISLLQSRFVRPLHYSGSRLESCCTALRRLQRARIPRRVLRAELDRLLPDRATDAPWSRLLRREAEGRWHARPRLPSEWTTVFSIVLDAWGWGSGRALDSLEYQQLAQWQEVIDSYAGIDRFTGRLDYEAAVATLERLLADAPFQPRTGDYGIQVLGPLETTGLDFDGLCLTGMSSGDWPASARLNPYLPNRLQRDQRMPHCDAAWEWERAQQRWQDWCAGSRYLQASYVSEKDGAPNFPSPLIANAAAHTVTAAYQVDPRWQQLRESARFSVVDDDFALVATEDGKPEALSSQVLEQQSNCPFQAFAATRLRASPAPQELAGLSAAERGTAMHRALYEFFGAYPDSRRLRAASSAEREAALKGAVNRALGSLRRERLAVVGQGAVDIEVLRLTRLLLAWLDVELKRPHDFRVIAREQECTLPLAGAIFDLRIDRMDQIENRTVIIDYKSGSHHSVERWRGPRPSRPQLLLYALLEPAADAISFASLRPADMGFRGLGEEALIPGIVSVEDWLGKEGDSAETTGAAPGMPLLRERWRQELGALTEEYLRGYNPVEPSPDACRYCRRFALCRLSDEDFHADHDTGDRRADA